MFQLVHLGPDWSNNDVSNIIFFSRSDYIQQATEDEDVTKLFFFLTIFVFVRAVERLDYICVSK